MPTNVTRRHPAFPQATVRPDRQHPGHPSPSRATSASAAPVQNKTCPRRAGRPPGWPATTRAGLGWVDRVWRPVVPPGLPHGTPGAELPESSPVASSAGPGPPCGRAPPGRRQAVRAYPSWRRARTPVTCRTARVARLRPPHPARSPRHVPRPADRRGRAEVRPEIRRCGQ